MKGNTVPRGAGPTPADADDLSGQIERTAYRQRLDAFLASREAASTLTLDSLRAGIRLEPVIQASAGVASFADEAIAIIKDEYRPALDCKEGCCYCCCKPGVLTSIPDLLRILNYLRSTLAAEAMSALGERARAYSAQMKGRNFNDAVNESVPCPLLLDSRCSVYEVRPLVCRGYNSTSVDACRRAHEDVNVGVPIFSVLKDVTDGATVGTAQRLEAEGLNDALVDLGTALSIALSAADGFSQAIVEGGAALSSAENSSWVTEMWALVRETARQVGVEV